MSVFFRVRRLAITDLSRDFCPIYDEWVDSGIRFRYAGANPKKKIFAPEMNSSPCEMNSQIPETNSKPSETNSGMVRISKTRVQRCGMVSRPCHFDRPKVSGLEEETFGRRRWADQETCPQNRGSEVGTDCTVLRNRSFNSARRGRAAMTGGGTEPFEFASLKVVDDGDLRGPSSNSSPATLRTSKSRMPASNSVGLRWSRAAIRRVSAGGRGLVRSSARRETVADVEVLFQFDQLALHVGLVRPLGHAEVVIPRRDGRIERRH